MQENVDQLPNAEDQLAELKIRDETERGGSTVSDIFELHVDSSNNLTARIGILYHRLSGWLRPLGISSRYIS